MLSHDNIYWTAVVAADYIQMRESTEVLVSYLPLSHIAGNMMDIWCIGKPKNKCFFQPPGGASVIFRILPSAFMAT